jgi:hypothetical protein
MSNNDQQLVDHLYNTIFVQKHRCDHFDFACNHAKNSIWNKYVDEKKILDNIVDKYKQYYKDKVESLKPKLDEMKEANIKSYLTYNKEYYISQYNKYMEEVTKYLVELKAKTFDHISKEKLSNISESLNLLFPGYMVDPTLLGRL